MLPIALNPRQIRAGLAGSGEGLERRRALLREAGAVPIEIQTYADEELQGLSVLFIAGLARSSAEALAARVRLQGVLVNVEDVPELCDFHVPAIVRRGALMLTASTAGCSPGLARRLREWLSDKFGTEWEERIETLRDLREQWRAQGLQPDDISNRTRTLVEKKGWL